jgi:hypothetical protein
LNPGVYIVIGEAFGKRLVNPHRPFFTAGERSPGSPDIRDTIDHSSTPPLLTPI